MRRIYHWFRQLSPSTAAVVVILLAGCGYSVASTGLNQVDEIMNRDSTQKMVPGAKCLPKCSRDFLNYVEHGKRAENPNTVQFCTVYPPTPGVKPFTIPIVRGFTGSNVSFYPTKRDYKPGDDGSGEYTPDRRSFDGMYHSTPLPYVYGFDAVTNGEHTVYGNPVMHCTDQPQSSQLLESTLDVKVVDNSRQLTNEINAALRRGDKAGATAAVAQIADLQK